jgi:hypothetical protein
LCSAESLAAGAEDEESELEVIDSARVINRRGFKEDSDLSEEKSATVLKLELSKLQAESSDGAVKVLLFCVHV